MSTFDVCESLWLVAFVPGGDSPQVREIGRRTLWLDGASLQISAAKESALVLVWGDDQGCWVKVLDEELVFLNGIPLTTRAPVKLKSGDSLILGEAQNASELLVVGSQQAARLSGADQNPEEICTKSSQGDWRNAQAGFQHLTKAEYEIVAWMARGVVEFTDLQAAMGRSINTIRTQLALVYRKLGVRSRASLLGLLLSESTRLSRTRSGLHLPKEPAGDAIAQPTGLGLRQTSDIK